MTRLLIFWLTSFATIGCAVSPTSPPPNPNWTRVSGERAGCVSFAPRLRESVDMNILLEPEFESALAEQLGTEVPKAPRCWYETPQGDIRLFAGDFCGVGTNSFFEVHESTWRLLKTEDVWTTCRPIK